MTARREGICRSSQAEFMISAELRPKLSLLGCGVSLLQTFRNLSGVESGVGDSHPHNYLVTIVCVFSLQHHHMAPLDQPGPP